MRRRALPARSRPPQARLSARLCTLAGTARMCTRLRMRVHVCASDHLVFVGGWVEKLELCVYVCVCARVRARVFVCLCVCVRARACACVCE